MDYFRKFLTLLRKGYNTRARKYFSLWGGILVASGASGVLVDLFVPFGAWWNLIRTAVLIPLSVSIFAVGYGIGLTLHYMRRTDPEWVPYRSRFSPLWRRRISAIAAALALLLVYASGQSPVFTFFSASVLAIGFSLIAFMRQTSEEMKREMLGIPDARDVSYESEFRKLQSRRREIAEERNSKRKINGRSRGSFLRGFRSSTPETNED